MKIILAAVGKMKASPEQALLQEYLTRLPWKVELREVEEKKKLSGDALKDAEGKLLLAALPTGARRIVLDEGGKQLTSREFAAKLDNLAMDGAPIAFLIGGADGHSKDVKHSADLLLSFGKQTYPHMLMRALLAEQIYRAWSILHKHPYHRG